MNRDELLATLTTLEKRLDLNAENCQDALRFYESSGQHESATQTRTWVQRCQADAVAIREAISLMPS